MKRKADLKIEISADGMFHMTKISHHGTLQSAKVDAIKTSKRLFKENNCKLGTFKVTIYKYGAERYQHTNLSFRSFGLAEKHPLTGDKPDIYIEAGSFKWCDTNAGRNHRYEENYAEQV